MNNVKAIEIMMKYFMSWNEQDISNLRNLFDDDITLTDWAIHEEGIEDVIKANKKIFNSVKSIHADVVETIVSENVGIAFLMICVEDIKGGDEVLPVIDIFRFNSENNKIKSITAYRRF